MKSKIRILVKPTRFKSLPSLATTLMLLNGRAFYRSIAAKHTAISRLGFKYRFAIAALIKI